MEVHPANFCWFIESRRGDTESVWMILIYSLYNSEEKYCKQLSFFDFIVSSWSWFLYTLNFYIFYYITWWWRNPTSYPQCRLVLSALSIVFDNVVQSDTDVIKNVVFYIYCSWVFAICWLMKVVSMFDSQYIYISVKSANLFQTSILLVWIFCRPSAICEGYMKISIKISRWDRIFQSWLKHAPA